MGINRILTNKLCRFLILVLINTLLIIACSANTQLQNEEVIKKTPKPDVLQLWWDKGYNPEEDEALKKLVRGWEQKTGNQVKINFYTLDKRSQKPQRSLQSGLVPDIFMSFKAESTLNPQLAWSGQLIDVTDVIKPVQKLYEPRALATAFY